MSIPENPYASPEAASEPIVLESVEYSDAERIRRKYINHETSVRSISSLYYLSAIVPSGLFIGFALNRPFALNRQTVAMLACAVIAILLVAFGVAVRQLRPWTRWPVGVCAILSLVAVPVGPIIGIYALYLVFGDKGRFVYSPEYAYIVVQTPHVKYRTPTALKWIVVLIVLAVLGLPFAAALLSKFSS